MVGLGTQDSLQLAEEFVDRNGTSTPLMTWDATFETWNHYEVRGQPTLILVDQGGQPLGTWHSLSDELIQRLAGDSSP